MNQLPLFQNQRPLLRLIGLLALIAACAVVALIAGKFLFPGNIKPILLVWLGLSIVVLIIPFLFWYLQPKREYTPRKDVISIFISIASSLILIGSLFLAWLSLDSTQQQTKKNLELSTTALEEARAEQRSRRFMEALEKLGGETPNKRLAGVYAFRKLDEDFKSEAEWSEVENNANQEEWPKLRLKREAELKEHLAIVDILTHFIQEITPRVKDPAKLPDPTVRVEVYEILKYLGLRKLCYNAGETKKLNFINVDLRGYPLQDVLNSDSNCSRYSCTERPQCRPNFNGAQFSQASLVGANLECFSLRNAKFSDADLTNAILRNADLSYADFTYAHLEGADLTGAILSKDDQLEFAYADKNTKCPTNLVFDAESHSCVKKSSN
jgi:pentapeptide repeat protein